MFSDDANGRIELNGVMVLHKRQAMPYLIYRAISPEAEDEEEVKQYAGYVGKKCAEHMLLYRSGSS